ncbi:MAG: D-alanyl-D-alanine carboxypeptidase, partial [Lachnospiraceae bacterium]|nr:D-alanyl-D-alanine carboxypeptidase [Lachnospiraceae bacterium]
TGASFANRPQPASSSASFANRPQPDRADRIAQAAQAQRRAERAQSSRADHAQTHSAQAAAGARSGQSDFNRRTREARMRRNEQLRRRRNFFRALPLIIVLLIAAGFGIYKLVQVAQEHAEIRAEQQRADEEARRHEQELLAQQEAEAAAAKAAEEEKAAALAALSERSPEVASFAEGYTVVDQNPAYIGLDQDGQSTYGVLIDVDAGKVIAAKNHHERIYPASMTKIMTVLVAIEKIQRAAIEQDVPVEDILNRKVVITQNHTNYAFSHGGSIVGFSIGETPTVEDLLYGTILPSGADAAAALAEFIVYDLGAVAGDETASASTGEVSAEEGQETAGTEGTQEGAAEAASAAEDGTAATAETTENAAESQILTATDAQAAAAAQNTAGTQAAGETAQTAPSEAETEEGEAEQAPQAEVDEAAVAAAAESVPAELNARLVEDTQEQFAVLMNEKVADLGLSSTTHFTNSVGMHDEQNYTTMVSMAMILKAAVENDLCRKVLSEHIYTTSKTPQHPNGIEISNWFLRRIEDKDSHGEVVAAKTGFVNESGCCSASYQVSNSGGHYICVTGNAWSSWRCIYDHVEVYEHFTN